jgi:hypothetical protein
VDRFRNGLNILVFLWRDCKPNCVHLGNRSNDVQPGSLYYEKPVFVHSTWNEPLIAMTEEQLVQVIVNILLYVLLYIEDLSGSV